MAHMNEIVEMLKQSAEAYLSRRQDGVKQKGQVGKIVPIDRSAWLEIAELGWLGLALPEHLNGSGMSLVEAAPLCEAFGRHLFPVPYIAGCLLPAVVLSAAKPAIAAEMANDLMTGEKLFSVAWQEHSGEMEVDALTTVVRNGKLYGRKRYVSSLEDDSILLVFAKSEANGEPDFVAISAAQTNVSIRRYPTAQGSISEVVFNGADLYSSGLMDSGTDAVLVLNKLIAWGRVASSAQLSGLARGCLLKTVDYVNQRKQFERTISSFQSVAHRCVDLFIEIELAEAVWESASIELSSASVAESCAIVYAAKARSTDTALLVGKTAVQLHGAMGFTEECEIGLYLRASMQYASWLGGSVGLRRKFLKNSSFFDAGEVA